MHHVSQPFTAYLVAVDANTRRVVDHVVTVHRGEVDGEGGASVLVCVRVASHPHNPKWNNCSTFAPLYTLFPAPFAS